MLIAFLHEENDLTNQLLDQFQQKLTGHQVLSWKSHEAAPSSTLDVILASSSISAEQIDRQPALALIQTTSTGYETVDINTATAAGIWVSFAPSDETGNATSVAEFAVLLLLTASRHIGELIAARFTNNAYQPRIRPVLNGRTVCIVGLGAIGQQVATRLQAFGMLIVATDEHPEHAPHYVTAFPADKLEVAVTDADFVVVCVRASNVNENLISASVLRSMKKGSVLINVARGLLVDEDALMDLLETGQIAAVGLDVVRREPLDASNRLLRFSQALVTPHIAAFTDLMVSGTTDYVSKVIEEFASGKRPSSLLNAPSRPRRLLS